MRENCTIVQIPKYPKDHIREKGNKRKKKKRKRRKKCTFLNGKLGLRWIRVPGCQKFKIQPVSIVSFFLSNLDWVAIPTYVIVIHFNSKDIIYNIIHEINFFILTFALIF